MNKTVIKPLVLNEHEIWAMLEQNLQAHGVFERRMQTTINRIFSDPNMKFWGSCFAAARLPTDLNIYVTKRSTCDQNENEQSRRCQSDTVFQWL